MAIEYDYKCFKLPLNQSEIIRFEAEAKLMTNEELFEQYGSLAE